MKETTIRDSYLHWNQGFSKSQKGTWTILLASLQLLTFDAYQTSSTRLASLYPCCEGPMRRGDEQSQWQLKLRKVKWDWFCHLLYRF